MCERPEKVQNGALFSCQMLGCVELFVEILEHQSTKVVVVLLDVKSNS